MTSSPMLVLGALLSLAGARPAAPGPKDVPVAVQLRNPKQFQARAQVVPVPARFVREVPGASSSLELVREEGTTSVVRVLRKPGVPPSRVDYTGITTAEGGKTLSGNGIDIVGARGGVLVLEKRSGIDVIPSNLWLFYKTETASPTNK